MAARIARHQQCGALRVAVSSSSAAPRPLTAAISTPTPTPQRAAEPAAPAPSDPAPGGGRRVGSRLSWLGLAVSLLAVAGVVWWASRQDPPQLPSSGPELAALVGAIALYALATLVRSRALAAAARRRGRQADADRHATRSPPSATWATTCCPRAPATRSAMVLMAPRAQTSMRTVLGTLLAERLLDVAVLVVIFVVVGYGLLGEVGGDKVEIILLVGGRGGRSPGCWPTSVRAPQRAARRPSCADRCPPRSACDAPTTGSCCSA